MNVFISIHVISNLIGNCLVINCQTGYVSNLFSFKKQHFSGDIESKELVLLTHLFRPPAICKGKLF